MIFAFLVLIGGLGFLLLVGLGQQWADRIDPGRLDRLNDTRAREGVPAWRTRA